MIGICIPGTGSASATYPDNAHTTAARERAKDPSSTSNEELRRDSRMSVALRLVSRGDVFGVEGIVRLIGVRRLGGSRHGEERGEVHGVHEVIRREAAATIRGNFKSASDGDVIHGAADVTRRQRRAHLPSLRAERTHRDDRVRLRETRRGGDSSGSRRGGDRARSGSRRGTRWVESFNSRRTWVISAIFRPSLLASRRTYQDGAQDGAHASEEETPQHSPRARDDASQVGGEQQKRNREGQEKLCHVRVRGRRRRDDADVAEEKGEEGGEEARAADARAPSLLVAPQAERRRAQDGGPHAPRIGGLDEGPGDGREALAERARADGVAARGRVAGRKAGCGAGCGAGDRRGGRARGRARGEGTTRTPSRGTFRTAERPLGRRKPPREECAARRDRTVRATRRGARRERDARNDVRDARDGRGHHACARGVGMTRARAAPREPPRNRPYPPRSRRSFACVGRRDESLFQKKASESACAANNPSTRRKPVSPL